MQEVREGEMEQAEEGGDEDYREASDGRHLGTAAEVLCLVFAKRGAVHYGQKSPLWSRLSKGHCSRSLVVFSDATLQT
ncbi:hypothetical protein FKM82_011170 [Ascaphus truei]